VRQLATHHDLLVTIEENTVMGGAGSAVGEFLAGEAIVKPLLQLGLPDYYVEHAKPGGDARRMRPGRRRHRLGGARAPGAA